MNQLEQNKVSHRPAFARFLTQTSQALNLDNPDKLDKTNALAMSVLGLEQFLASAAREKLCNCVNLGVDYSIP
jgi:hypothetical protein